jgi:hypothetical protein
MSPNKTASFDELQIAAHFEQIRGILLQEEYREHRERPLAFWSLPSDRRLPLAFMGRTIREILDTPFEDLASTPSIGEKKIRSLLRLLGRAVNTKAHDLPQNDVIAVETPGEASETPSRPFDYASVSEIEWKKWQKMILDKGLGNEMIGRLSPSLEGMTRSIWNKPLKEYARISLEDLRSMKTHGEKRIQSILSVFHGVYRVVSQLDSPGHLSLRLMPKWIDRAETWVQIQLQQWGIPRQEIILDGFIMPLVEQVRIDASPQVVQLAENRLGLHHSITSVRQAAKNMGLARARVYQLLNEINDIMMVRWPTGRSQVYQLQDKFIQEKRDHLSSDFFEQFHAAVELFYPGSRRGAAGPIAPPEHIECLVHREKTPGNNGRSNGMQAVGDGSPSELFSES